MSVVHVHLYALRSEDLRSHLLKQEEELWKNVENKGGTTSE